MNSSVSSTPGLRVNAQPLWGILLFALILVAGLYSVKWSPYYAKAWLAAETHSIGSSIINNADGQLPPASLQAALDYAWGYGKAIWKALLLGLLLGSGLQVLLPPQWILRWLGKTNGRGVFTGSLLSIPGMMCTCCAAPVINGLRERQAAAGNTVAFWLGNTMLNPATLIFMGLVLGWHWAGLRLVLGIVMVLGLGWTLNYLQARRQPANSAAACMDEATASCTQPVVSTRRGSCEIFQQWGKLFTRMALRLLPEYLILVLLLGAARVWLFPAVDSSLGNNALWILAAAVGGMLFVIPTAAEVPIVQTLLASGVAAGPAAALLLTLPPVSLPSLAMVARAFHPLELAVLVSGVIICGLLAAAAAIAMGF